MFLPTTGIFKSTCYIDVRWFPFDVQRCDLKFGSWTYGGWSLDLKMLDADITGYIANGEWDLVGKRRPVKCRGFLFKCASQMLLLLSLSAKRSFPRSIALHFCRSRLCFVLSRRGSRAEERAFLRLLRGAVPRRHLHRGDAQTDALLRPQSAHPVCPDLHSGPARLPSARRLWREDLTGLGTHTHTQCSLKRLCDQ